MILALVTGSLFRPAESRVSKNGKSYVKATVKEGASDDICWVNVVAFSESAQEELLRLADGDAPSVQGPLKAETYTAADGATKVSLSVIANHVLALRQPPKERDDFKRDGNPGLRDARKAAQPVGASVAVPDFGADRLDDATDFNDLCRIAGPDAVRACIEKAAPVSAR